MNNLLKKILILLISISYILGCDNTVDDYNEGDFFYIRNKGADMPVWVLGNKKSKVFMIHLHGGPGGSAIAYNFSNLFEVVKDEYAQVYYDQRSSGFSHGISTIEDLNMDQFIDDTDTIIDAINLMYDNPDIFLVGVSWGGALGTAYLLDQERQSKIKGWIEIDGSHNKVWANELSRQFVIDYADSQIENPLTSSGNKDKWSNVVSWYENNLVINNDNEAKHTEYVTDAHGYLPEGEELSEQSELDEIILSSRANMLQLYFNSETILNNFDTNNMNYTPQMGEITLPTLIIWGEKDGKLPVPLAQQTYESIGTPEIDKSVVILPNSGHSPVKTDMELFKTSMIYFIDTNKNP